MNILTFDTSLDKTYVTISSNSKILSSEVIENHDEKYHSAFLMPAIVSLLKKNNLTMQDINAIATNIGPGSFTGIRACVTVARVFAQQLEIPLVGVSSLEILSSINDSQKPSLVVLDARKNQFYTAVYSCDGKEIQKPELTNKDDLLNFDFGQYFVISDEASKKVLRDNGHDSVVYSSMNPQLGLFLNKIAELKLKNANKDEYLWGKLKPLYLQAPPISTPKK